MPELFAPPLWFVAWGVFFHTFSAVVGFRMTTKIPFCSGAVALLVRVCFSLATFSTVLNHVYHLLGLSLEVQETVFLSGLAVLLPSQFCMCRCFFFAVPRNRALLLTVLNIAAITIWPNVTKAAFDLRGDQPFVLGTPEYFEAQGWRAPAQHFATELGIVLVNIFTYMQMMAAVPSDKAHKA